MYIKEKIRKFYTYWTSSFTVKKNFFFNFVFFNDNYYHDKSSNKKNRTVEWKLKRSKVKYILSKNFFEYKLDKLSNKNFIFL